MSAATAIARFTARRAVRMRSLWMVAVLMVAPVVTVVVEIGPNKIPDLVWGSVVRTGLRMVVVAASALSVAVALDDDRRSGVYLYLWARPVSAMTYLLGKLMFFVPVMFIAAILSFAVAYLVLAFHDLAPGASGLVSLAGTLVVAVPVACALGAGLASLAPKSPLLVTIIYVLGVEQIAPVAPILSALSVLHQTLRLAGQGTAGDQSVTRAAVRLVILAGLWVVIAHRRLRTAAPAG
jgi:hypothetical protein